MTKIRVEGLSRLDSLDLQRRFAEAEIAFEEADTSDPRHGELATIAVVTVSLAGLRALASWLLKDRRSAHIVKTVSVTGPDGTTRTETIDITVTESTSEADVVNALASMTQFDLSRAE